MLIPRDVPVRDHRELIAWQLANELRGLIIQVTAEGPSARDFKLKSQINDAISSVCRNLSEGFYMYGHREFARYVRTARGSLGETQDLIDEGRQKKYWEGDLYGRLESLGRRAMIATSRLHRYLRGSDEP